MTEINAIVAALMSNDNNARKRAEEAYEIAKKTNPEVLVIELLQLLRIESDAGLRSFAPVLLRRLIEEKYGIFSMLSAQSCATLKLQLLQALGNEEIPHIRRKICHTIAELALIFSRAGESWEDLFSWITALASSENRGLRESAFDLIECLSDYVGRILVPHRESFLTLFTNSLSDSSEDVQVACLKAASSFLLVLEDQSDLMSFGIIISPMMRIIEQMIKQGDEVSLREILSSLVKLGEVHARFFRHRLDDIGQAMLYISTLTDIENDTRELALEFLLSLCENAGGMVRKSQFLVQNLVPVALQLMCEVEDDATWVDKFDDPETFSESINDENSISDAGAAAIDRLSNALGGNAVLPVAIPVIKAYLADQDWRKRRAALYGTCLLGEGSKKLMSAELDNVVCLVMPFFEDPHPRVQYAAIHCIGQLADDFGEVTKGKNFQARFHTVALPKLTSIIGNTQAVLRSRALAASVVINFCDPNVCKKTYVRKYSEGLLEALFNAIRACPRQVQEQSITAVASIARVIEHDFDRFYPLFIPIAKDMLLNAKGKEYSLLRGKAMESIALIGQAVGKEQFFQDAKEVMNILIQVQNDSSLDGPEVQYVAQACVRIGNILREDFVPYLPHVVPRLIAQAKIEPDIVLSDVGEDEDVDEEADGKDVMTLDIRGVGKRRIQINTSALEEKTNACNMLYQCALDLEGAFCPFVQEVVSVMVPLFTFQYVEDIRIVSSLSMSRLLNAAVEGCRAGNIPDANFPQNIFRQFFEPLLVALQHEDDLEVLGALAEACSASLQMCKDALAKGIQVGVPIEHVPQVVEVFKSVASASATRLLHQLQLSKQDEDYDEYAALQQNENNELEEGVLRSMIDSIGWMIKSYKESFFPIFNTHLLPWITPLLDTNMMHIIRGPAICMIDDVIEHCGSRAVELVPTFISHLLNGVDDSSNLVIQASAYGLGVCAQSYGAEFDPFCSQALQNLVRFIECTAQAVDEEVAAARDNAVSAVSKICISRGNTFDTSQLWHTWLSWLPLYTDVLEAREVHDRLISLVDGGNIEVVGKDYSNLPLILKAFAAILEFDSNAEDDVADDDDDDLSIISENSRMKLRELLVKLQKSLQPTVVQHAWMMLTPEEQQALTHV